MTSQFLELWMLLTAKGYHIRKNFYTHLQYGSKLSHTVYKVYVINVLMIP